MRWFSSFRKDRHLDLLRQLAPARSLPIARWLDHVVRDNRDYTDFYEAASLFQRGLVNANTLGGQGLPAGSLGEDIDETAQILCQFTLQAGESFVVDVGVPPRQPWDPEGVRVFVTERGFDRLNEISNKGVDRRLMVLVALLGASAGAVLTALAEQVFRIPQ